MNKSTDRTVDIAVTETQPLEQEIKALATGMGIDLVGFTDLLISTDKRKP